MDQHVTPSFCSLYLFAIAIIFCSFSNESFNPVQIKQPSSFSTSSCSCFHWSWPRIPPAKYTYTSVKTLLHNFQQITICSSLSVKQPQDFTVTFTRSFVSAKAGTRLRNRVIAMTSQMFSSVWWRSVQWHRRSVLLPPIDRLCDLCGDSPYSSTFHTCHNHFLCNTSGLHLNPSRYILDILPLLSPMHGLYEPRIPA